MAAEASAQTFDSAASNALNPICQQSFTFIPGSPPTATANTGKLSKGGLDNICSSIVASGVTSAGLGSTSGPGAISAPTAAAFIEQRRRTSSEGREETSKPGASSDSARYSLGGGLNAFVSAGGEALSHRNNKFESGYSSTVPSATAGADYRLTDWMTAGLALNYSYQDGTYDDVGHFHTQSYGPLLFASFVPLANMFADLAFGYNHQDYFRNRPAAAFDSAGTELANGHARGNYNGDQYSVGLLSGYDYPLEGFTIGPRGGLNYVYYDVENYNETNASGLALRYSGLNQSSLQTALGAVALMPISTSFGVVQPQLGVSWVHEFLNDSRNIQAEFRDTTDPAATQFTFQREQPARNWAVIDVGVSVVLPNQVQPFVNFTTMQGNENFVTYGGVLGVRMSL